MTHIQTGSRIVTQITVIEAEPENQDEALSLMADRARFMARQPGFVSISLHRSLDGRRIVNYVHGKIANCCSPPTDHQTFARNGASLTT
jgi:Antibiotic biosynthesis monooxygenase